MRAEARKIDARNGGSITKNRIAPDSSATMLEIIAQNMLTVRSWFIARPRTRAADMKRLTRRAAEV